MVSAQTLIFFPLPARCSRTIDHRFWSGSVAVAFPSGDGRLQFNLGHRLYNVLCLFSLRSLALTWMLRGEKLCKYRLFPRFPHAQTGLSQKWAPQIRRRPSGRIARSRCEVLSRVTLISLGKYSSRPAPQRRSLTSVRLLGCFISDIY